MGIESERPALSVESIPKSVSEAQMDQTGEQVASDNLKLPTEVNGRVIQLKGGEKNGNLDRQTSSR